MPDISKGIEAGYLLVITSWENDADNYHDAEFQGLHIDDVNFLLDFATEFTLPKAFEYTGLGNQYHYSTKLADLLVKKADQHPNVSSQLKDAFDIDALRTHLELVEVDDDFEPLDSSEATDAINDTMMDNLQRLFDDNEYDYNCYEEHKIFARVFDSFKLFFFEEPVPPINFAPLAAGWDKKFSKFRSKK